jgi:hypothetical protein
MWHDRDRSPEHNWGSPASADTRFHAASDCWCAVILS